MDHRKKPGTPEELVVEHHGVKGMRWGVRKQDDTGGDRGSAKEVADHNAAAKQYMAAASVQQAEAATWSDERKAANIEKWRAANLKKFEPPSTGKASPSDKPESPGVIADAKERWNKLSPDQKALAVQATAGAAIIGGLLAYNAYASRFSLPASAYLPVQDNLKFKPGDKIPLGTYLARIGKSQDEVHSVENFFRPEAFAREPFTLPAGHIFKRISSAPENEFWSGTYASASDDDFHRYACALGVGGVKRHLIEFEAKAPVKVPSLTQVLGTVREEMAADYGFHPSKISERQVLERYKSVSHQQWKGGEAVSLIDALKKKGYGAIVDEMDAGVFSNKPLVVFSSKDLGPKSNKVLKRSDLKKSLSKLREIDNPPGRAGYAGKAFDQKNLTQKEASDPVAAFLKKAGGQKEAEALAQQFQNAFA